MDKRVLLTSLSYLVQQIATTVSPPPSPTDVPKGALPFTVQPAAAAWAFPLEKVIVQKD